MLSKLLNPLLFIIVLLSVAACAPAFAPADENTDGDLDTDISEPDEVEIETVEEDTAENEAEPDAENPFDNGLKFLDKNGQPADLGRQGQTISDLVIRFREPEKVSEALDFNEELPLFYTLDFGDRIQVTFSKFDAENFEFSEVDISISGLARTGDRPVYCYLENGHNSVNIGGVFWVLPSQTSNSLNGGLEDVSNLHE